MILNNIKKRIENYLNNSDESSRIAEDNAKQIVEQDIASTEKEVANNGTDNNETVAASKIAPEVQREEVEKQFINSKLQGKYKIRKIDDNTFINFADFILNNLENAEYNIEKIRNSLAIMKDGQAVFTNLEKCYIYRYITTF